MASRYKTTLTSYYIPANKRRYNQLQRCNLVLIYVALQCYHNILKIKKNQLLYFLSFITYSKTKEVIFYCFNNIFPE